MRRWRDGLLAGLLVVNAGPDTRLTNTLAGAVEAGAAGIGDVVDFAVTIIVFAVAGLGRWGDRSLANLPTPLASEGARLAGAQAIGVGTGLASPSQVVDLAIAVIVLPVTRFRGGLNGLLASFFARRADPDSRLTNALASAVGAGLAQLGDVIDGAVAVIICIVAGLSLGLIDLPADDAARLAGGLAGRAGALSTFYGAGFTRVGQLAVVNFAVTVVVFAVAGFRLGRSFTHALAPAETSAETFTLLLTLFTEASPLGIGRAGVAVSGWVGEHTTAVDAVVDFAVAVVVLLVADLFRGLDHLLAGFLVFFAGPDTCFAQSFSFGIIAFLPEVGQVIDSTVTIVVLAVAGFVFGFARLVTDELTLDTLKPTNGASPLLIRDRTGQSLIRQVVVDSAIAVVVFAIADLEGRLAPDDALATLANLTFFAEQRGFAFPPALRGFASLLTLATGKGVIGGTLACTTPTTSDTLVVFANLPVTTVAISQALHTAGFAGTNKLVRTILVRTANTFVVGIAPTGG